jgi:hypothetical protein
VAFCNDSCASASRESVSALFACAVFFFAASSRAHRCASMRPANRLWHLDSSSLLIDRTRAMWNLCMSWSCLLMPRKALPRFTRERRFASPRGEMLSARFHTQSLLYPKEILVVYAWGHGWVEASGSLVAVWPLSCVVGTEGLVTLNGLLFFFFFCFDQVQASLLLVIRKVCCSHGRLSLGRSVTGKPLA